MSINIFTKIEYPPSGFILQKDVYTTNLLYANDQFPLTYLKQRLPFRPPKKLNPNNSVKILRQNGKVSDNSENKKEFYFFNTFKPKYLNKKKLKFPIPQVKTIPLTNLNLYEEISKKDIKIQNIDDDLNITSNNGRKIFYRFKEHKIFTDKKSVFPPISLSTNFANAKKLREETSMAKISLKNLINQLNEELRDLRQMELERKKSFYKDKFFSTQVDLNKLLGK
jgi:hypothetical protein